MDTTQRTANPQKRLDAITEEPSDTRLLHPKQDPLEYLTIGLQQGATEVIGQFECEQVARFTQFVEESFIQLVNKGSNTTITVIQKAFSAVLKQTDDSIDISIGDKKSTLPQTSLNQLLEKITQEIISHPKAFTKDVFNTALRQALQASANENNELPGSTTLAINYVCKHTKSTSKELKFAAANHMYQHLDHYTDEQLGKITELILLEAKPPYSYSLPATAKHIISNTDNFSQEFTWSALLYCILNTKPHTIFFNFAANYIVQHRDKCPKYFATEAAFRFVEHNKDFFTAPQKKPTLFTAFFSLPERIGIISDYSNALYAALVSNKEQYKIYETQSDGSLKHVKTLSVLGQWNEHSFEGALRSDRDNETVACCILQKIQDEALRLWNVDTEVSEAYFLVPHSSSPPTSN